MHMNQKIPLSIIHLLINKKNMVYRCIVAVGSIYFSNS